MTSPNLSDTARAVLQSASETSDHLVVFPEHLPAAARQAVVRSMLKSGLVEEAPADDDQPAWRTSDTGERLLLRASLAGLAAIGARSLDEGGPVPRAPGEGGLDHAPDTLPPATDITAHAGPHSPRVRLRAAAAAALAAWDDTTQARSGLPTALEALRAELTATLTRAGLPRPPRSGTKQEAVLALLRRPEGATIAQIADATGWQQHTVRGFLAGLNKKGITVGVLERVRQVGPGSQGAKGSYTVYRVEEAG